VRYYTPDEFARLKEEGEARGFKWMESGPLVRSSYHADGQAHLSPRFPTAQRAMSAGSL
jgi:lipoic acid synthetase